MTKVTRVRSLCFTHRLQMQGWQIELWLVKRKIPICMAIRLAHIQALRGSCSESERRQAFVFLLSITR